MQVTRLLLKRANSWLETLVACCFMNSSIASCLSRKWTWASLAASWFLLNVSAPLEKVFVGSEGSSVESVVSTSEASASEWLAEVTVSRQLQLNLWCQRVGAKPYWSNWSVPATSGCVSKHEMPSVELLTALEGILLCSSAKFKEPTRVLPSFSAVRLTPYPSWTHARCKLWEIVKDSGRILRKFPMATQQLSSTLITSQLHQLYIGGSYAQRDELDNYGGFDSAWSALGCSVSELGKILPRFWQLLCQFSQSGLKSTSWSTQMVRILYTKSN